MAFLILSGIALFILSLCLANSISGICIGLLAALCAYLAFVARRKKVDRWLVGGFEVHKGRDWSEDQFLRIVIIEELNRRKSTMQYFVNRKRYVLTAGYSVLCGLLIWLLHAKVAFIPLFSILTMVYAILFGVNDPISQICRICKKNPDKEFSKILEELSSDQPPVRQFYKSVGILALSVCLAIALSSKDRFSFAPTDNGYMLTKATPGIFTRELQIPESYQGEPVVAIGESALSGNVFMTQLEIPETVTDIGSYAFKNCRRLRSVSLPEGLITLNGESFKNCKRLQSIVIPKGVTEIRGNTFEYCESLESVTLHNGIVDIHAYAFRGCTSLQQIQLPDKITRIATYTFDGCTALEQITIPDGVTKIAAHAFSNCDALHTVNLPNSLQEIGSSAFRSCKSLNEIDVLWGVSIDERAFKDSYTDINRKFTDFDTMRITQEANRITPETFYYVVNDAGAVVTKEGTTDTVIIADDLRYNSLLKSGQTLLPMPRGYQGLLQWLEILQSKGLYTNVRYEKFSPLATQIAGTECFLVKTMSIDEMIAECRVWIPEE